MTPHHHFLPLYKGEAKPSRIWAPPSFTDDVPTHTVSRAGRPLTRGLWLLEVTLYPTLLLMNDGTKPPTASEWLNMTVHLSFYSIKWPMKTDLIREKNNGSYSSVIRTWVVLESANLHRGYTSWILDLNDDPGCRRLEEIYVESMEEHVSLATPELFPSSKPLSVRLSFPSVSVTLLFHLLHQWPGTTLRLPVLVEKWLTHFLCAVNRARIAEWRRRSPSKRIVPYVFTPKRGDQFLKKCV